jgi:hypothetical protein
MLACLSLIAAAQYKSYGTQKKSVLFSILQIKKLNTTRERNEE